MTPEQIRAQIIANVWQAFAQSGVDLTAVTKEDQEKLAASIADGLLDAVDKMLDEAQPPASPESTRRRCSNTSGYRLSIAAPRSPKGSVRRASLRRGPR